MFKKQKNTWAISIAVVVAVIIVSGGVCVWQRLGPQPVKGLSQRQIIDTENQNDKMVGLKIYQDKNFGIEFKYNPKWSIAPINTGSGYDYSRPFILLWSGEISDDVCQDLGCTPKTGDRDVLDKGCTFEGAPPLNPWFKILRVRGNKWVSIQVTDVTKNCQTAEYCHQYIAQAPLNQKIRINKIDYQVYNDFIELISTLKFNE